MTNRHKRWLTYEVLATIMLIGAIALVPKMPTWKYFLLGVCIGLYAQFRISQDRL
jgi:hypothetical protein